MKKAYLGFVSVLSTGLVLFLVSSVQASSQPLVPSTPTGTDGVNISINPEEPLPANGTVSISTERAADSDMNVFPPEGVSVIISSNSVTVANQPVDIATAEREDEEAETEEEVGGDEEGEEEGSELASFQLAPPRLDVTG